MGASACNRSRSAAAAGVKRISSSPGVICEGMSAKGGSSALIGEDWEQIMIRSKMPIGRILERVIMAISSRKLCVSGAYDAN